MKKVILVFVVVASSTVMTGCAASHSMPWEDGHVTISGDPKGIRAFGDAMNGLITNGKASPDKDTAHWINRRHEEAQITERTVSKPGFFGGLFSTGRPVGQSTDEASGS